jgi:cell wall-active antibiotic response 4TMS protein YvqF/uncharacterized protein DUF1707
MADVPVPSLARAREQKINELSVHFANDDLSLEDLERRIEQVYKAASVVELESITADLRRAAAPAPSASPAQLPRLRGTGTAVAPREMHQGTRLLALMSSTRRVGRWVVPPNMDIVAIMSDTKLDLTHAVLPAGLVDFEIRAVMASLKVIVPPGVRVLTDIHSVMANVRSRADEFDADVPPSPSAPVIRLTGYAVMADVNIVVRRREEPILDDDDDDDD